MNWWNVLALVLLATAIIYELVVLRTVGWAVLGGAAIIACMGRN